MFEFTKQGIASVVSLFSQEILSNTITSLTVTFSPLNLYCNRPNFLEANAITLILTNAGYVVHGIAKAVDQALLLPGRACAILFWLIYF